MKILNKIIKKEATVQEKLTYLFPAIISILYLIDLILLAALGKVLFRKLIPEFTNISRAIFIFSSIYVAYKNYDYFKKINSASLLFVYFCFFWIYASLYSIALWSFGYYIFIITLILQIYLLFNLYLDIKFNIFNIDAVSSSFNLNFSKNKFNLNFFKNKFVIGALILFGVLILYNLFSKSESVDSTGQLLEGLTRPVPNSQGSLWTCNYETKDGKRFSKDFPNKFMNPCPRYYNLKTGEFSSY
jgi:hypothetical protein